MSNHIIIATDYSDAADNALKYACNLAKDYNKELLIIHSFIIPVSVGENPVPVMPMEEGMEIAKERMGTLLKEYETAYPDLKISTKVVYGDMIDNMQDMVENKKPWMIVLGNYTAQDDFVWLGSNLIGAMRHVNVPVLGIPLHYSYKKIEKICYSCDFKNNDDENLAHKLTELVNTLGAQLQVLYVDNKSNESGAEQQLNMQGSLFHTSLKDIEPVYNFVEKENVSEAVEEFIAQQNIDWLIVVPHKYSFFESLFHKSHTKSFAKRTPVPLLALHGQK